MEVDWIDELNKYSGDVYLYYGPIARRGYQQISSLLEGKIGKSESACLILVTTGGDPDAGYRIARAINHHYAKVDVLIPDVCKSAGTLMCVGADRLIFGDRGELGPLDIQISNPDEIFENKSGLNIMNALVLLQQETITAFKNYLLDIRAGSRLRTKMAADISTKLVESIITPIAAKIDPVTIAEHQRAIQIALDYGTRLNKKCQNLRSNDSLNRLISGYPSHEFVIDRAEAREIFNQVVAPEDDTIGLYYWARWLVDSHQMPDGYELPLVADVKHEYTAENQSNRERPDEADQIDDGNVDETVTSINQGADGQNAGSEPDSFEPSTQER